MLHAVKSFHKVAVLSQCLPGRKKLTYYCLSAPHNTALYDFLLFTIIIIIIIITHSICFIGV